MPRREPEYRGLVAEAWDALRGDTSQWPDRQFYLDVIARFGQPVLDIGCGTGRLLIDYRLGGIDIDGVDNSPDMLSICQRKLEAVKARASVFWQHMEVLSLPRRYATILIPSSSLQLLTDREDALEALRRIRGHLLDGGGVAASFMTLWSVGEPLESPTKTIVARPAPGVEYRRTSRSWFDPLTACESTCDDYEKRVDGQLVRRDSYVRSPAVLSYTQEQASRLLEEAGFLNVALLHKFTAELARGDDRLFTVIAS